MIALQRRTTNDTCETHVKLQSTAMPKTLTDVDGVNSGAFKINTEI